MLKIKDYKEPNEERFNELVKKYNLETYADSDCESDWSYYIGFDGGVFIDYYNGEINGIDCSNLDLLYDLIKDGLVEKVQD